MNRRFHIKVCGLTAVDNLRDVLSTGVDAIGVISCPSSPRHVAAQDAAELLEVSCHTAPSVERHWVVRGVSLTELDAALSAGLHCTHVQLHGGYAQEAADVVRDHGRQPVQVHSMVDDVFPSVWPGIERVLLDTPGKTGGGTGRSFDWNALASWNAPSLEVVVAGGLHPGMAQEALLHLPEWVTGLDLNSGVETSPGIKSPERIHQFKTLCTS